MTANTATRFGRPDTGALAISEYFHGFVIARLTDGTYRDICEACDGTGARETGRNCRTCRATGLRKIVGTGTREELVAWLAR